MAARFQVQKKTLMQLWKQGWEEIPAVMATAPYFIIGVVGCATYGYLWQKNDWGNHRYKLRYVVYRPDDPRVERIRKFEDSPPMTSVSKTKAPTC